jgi:hypothetical protein
MIGVQTMFNEIMLHIKHFEQSNIKKFNEHESRFGVPDNYFPQSFRMEDVTIEDAFESFYLPLWGKSLVDYIPEELRAMFFDCCIITSVSNAVNLLRQSIGVEIDKPVIDIRLCEELRRMNEMEPQTLRRCYAGRLHAFYSELAPKLGLRHQLNTRLVACYDIVDQHNVV